MSFSLSEADKKELKDHTSTLIKQLEERIEATSKERNRKLMKVLKDTRKDVTQCKEKTNYLEEENNALKHQVALLTSEVQDLVGQKRASNMIVYGMEEKVDEDEQGDGQILVQNIIKAFKEVQIDIESKDIVTAERIGLPGANKVRPILIKVSHPPIKKKIFEKGKDLYATKKISVQNDLTRTQRKEKKELGIAKKLLESPDIHLKFKGLSLVWNDTQLNSRQALDLYNSLRERDFSIGKHLQRQREEDLESFGSEESLNSLCSQGSKRKRRKAFSYNVLESVQIGETMDTSVADIGRNTGSGGRAGAQAGQNTRGKGTGNRGRGAQ